MLLRSRRIGDAEKRFEAVGRGRDERGVAFPEAPVVLPVERVAPAVSAVARDRKLQEASSSILRVGKIGLVTGDCVEVEEPENELSLGRRESLFPDKEPARAREQHFHRHQRGHEQCAQGVLRIVESSSEKSVSRAPEVVGVMALDAVLVEPSDKGKRRTPHRLVRRGRRHAASSLRSDAGIARGTEPARLDRAQPLRVSGEPNSDTTSPRQVLRQMTRGSVRPVLGMSNRDNRRRPLRVVKPAQPVLGDRHQRLSRHRGKVELGKAEVEQLADIGGDAVESP